MDNRKLGRAPDFTNACIVMFGVNLSWVLLLLFVLYGLIAVVVAGLALNHALDWLDSRRHIAEQSTKPRADS